MRRRTFLLGAAGAAVATSIPARATAAPTVVGTIAEGLDIPWGLDFLPDGSALVTERDTARLLRVTPAGTVTTITTIPGVGHGGEGGLLGLAVSPDYATDRRIYLYHSTDADNRVGWATYDGTSLSAVTYIVTGIPHGSIHNGGSLEFNAAKRLFVGCGESGNSALAQDPRSLGGKILRLTKSGAATLTSSTRDPRIFSWGHRNPEGLAFYDRNGTSEMWGAELGWNTWDELNLLQVGHNYGWPRSEGTDGPGGYTDPLLQWAPSTCSPSGIAVRGKQAWIGALRGQSLWRVDLHGPDRGRRTRFFEGTYGRMRNVKTAPDGTLWVTTSNGGDGDAILQVQPAQAG